MKLNYIYIFRFIYIKNKKIIKIIIKLKLIFLNKSTKIMYLSFLLLEQLILQELFFNISYITDLSSLLLFDISMA